MEAKPTRESETYSVRALLASKPRGRVKVRDIGFSTSPLRVCFFKAKVGPPILSKTKYLDSSSARLRGDSFLVQDNPIPALPEDAFRLSQNGWVYGSKEMRLGDVLDILIDARLRVVEFTIQLRHSLTMPEDTLQLLTKEQRKAYTKTVPDASGAGGDAYTLCQLPASEVTRIRTEELIYEVHTKIEVEDLTNAIFRALQTGREEKGLVRNLFNDALDLRGRR